MQSSEEVVLPTLLGNRTLPVDIARHGPFVSFKVNGFSRVVVKNGAARDGVIHAVSDVLIPPKQVGGVEQQWDGKEISADELEARLAPYVDGVASVASEVQESEVRWEM